MNIPTPPSGTGFVVVSLVAVLASLGVMQVEMQGLTEHTRHLTGIRTSGQPAAAARAGVAQRVVASEGATGGLLTVANEVIAK